MKSLSPVMKRWIIRAASAVDCKVEPKPATKDALYTRRLLSSDGVLTAKGLAEAVKLCSPEEVWLCPIDSRCLEPREQCRCGAPGQRWFIFDGGQVPATWPKVFDIHRFIGELPSEPKARSVSSPASTFKACQLPLF